MSRQSIDDIPLTDPPEMSPEDPDLYYKRACLYFGEQEFDLSEQDVDSVIKLSNGTITSRARLLKSRIYTSRGDWKFSRQLLTENFNQSDAFGAQSSEQLRIIDILESRWSEAKNAERRRKFADCYRISSTLIDRSPHSRRVRELHASCAFETFHLQQTGSDLTTLAKLRDASVDDFLNAARFSYFFAPEGGSSNSLKLLRECLQRFSRNVECPSLGKRFKKLDTSFVLLAELLQAEDWKGLVSYLIQTRANQTTPGFLPKFDVELSRSLSAVSFDTKQVSKRRRLLTRLLCVSAENLSLDTISLNIWCRNHGTRFRPRAAPREATLGEMAREIWGWISA
ncbi:hypothetical protein ACEPAF_4447 [Sanghuangporus sanghuang]